MACAAFCLTVFCIWANGQARAELAPISDPDIILGDWPQYVDAIEQADYPHYQGPALVDTPGGDLAVRAWQYSSTLDAIVESNNVLASEQTALIVVNPWGIEDGQGWDFPKTYNPSGHAFLGILPDNEHYNNQLHDAVKGFVDDTRGRVPLLLYGMPGSADSTRYKLYRDYTHQPSVADRAEGRTEIADYFDALTSSQWPDKIPVHASLSNAPGDVVAYDDLGYSQLKTFLQSYGIENVLLAGYAADTDLATAPAGYVNLKNDFNVFVVGDATMSVWPVTTDIPPQYTKVSTRDAVIAAATDESSVAATQISWIEQLAHDPAGGPTWRGGLLASMGEWNNWQKTVSDDDPLQDSRRAADYWETSLDSATYSTDNFADEFDEGKIEVLGSYQGQTNVAKVNPQQELALHLPTPGEDSSESEVWVKITWLRDDGSPSQEPLWTLDLYNGGTPGGDGTLTRESRNVGAGGWLTDVYTATLAADAESTILRLGFANDPAYVDSIVVDLKIGMQNYPGDANHDGRVDEIDATLLAANWGAQGGATWNQGDFNGDGNVNNTDAAVIAANWLHNFLEPTAVAVPEPSTTCLFVLVIAGLFVIPYSGRKRPG